MRTHVYFLVDNDFSIVKNVIRRRNHHEARVPLKSQPAELYSSYINRRWRHSNTERSNHDSKCEKDCLETLKVPEGRRVSFRFVASRKISNCNRRENETNSP